MDIESAERTLSEAGIEADMFGMSMTELAEKRLADSAPDCAREIIRLALQGSTEGIRLRAATWVIDHINGRATSPLDDPIRKLVDSITVVD